MENYNENVLKLRVREKELTEQLEYWEQYPPVNNMGKWARQTRLDSLKEKLKKVKEKIEFHDSIYLSNEIYKQWKEDVSK